MKIIFKRYKVEYDEIEVDMASVDYHYDGDILEALKYEDNYRNREGMEYEILDCKPSEKEINRNVLEKGFETISKYRNNEDLGLYESDSQERVIFWNYMR